VAWNLLCPETRRVSWDHNIWEDVMMERNSRRSTLKSTALALGVLFAATAGAHERNAGRGTCVQSVQQTKAACIADCVDTARSEFATCFGPGKVCAQTCLTARLNCEAGPLKKVKACVGDPGNPDSCKSQLKTALLACKTDPDPITCRNTAALNALKCRQACVDAQAPAIQICRDAFRMCLKACPSSPSGAFIDAPQF
jgi:hypothetical protein